MRHNGASNTPDAAEVPAPSALLEGETLESVTQLILRAQEGHENGWDHVYAALYSELHQLARKQLRKSWKGAERSPTSLIAQAWLRLNSSRLTVASRSHLVAILARAMRYAILDETRRTLAEKRGQGEGELPLEDEALALAVIPDLERLLALDQALNELASYDSRLGQLVELRYFGGMTDDEVAHVLEVNPRTVRRDWRRARSFLAARLGGPELEDSAA